MNSVARYFKSSRKFIESKFDIHLGLSSRMELRKHVQRQIIASEEVFGGELPARVRQKPIIDIAYSFIHEEYGLGKEDSKKLMDILYGGEGRQLIDKIRQINISYGS